MRFKIFKPIFIMGFFWFSLCGYPANALPFFSETRIYLPSSYVKSYSGIKSLGVADGADPNLFCLPWQFPHLEYLSLSCNPNSIDKYLTDLTIAYPELTHFGIYQKIALGDSTSLLLSKLKNIRSLHLDFPSTNVQLLAQSLPKSLEELFINPNSNLASEGQKGINLPNLVFLHLCGNEVNKDFIVNSTLPKLERILFLNLELQPGTIVDLAKFENLKRIEFEGTTISESDIAFLKSKRIKVIVIPSQSN